MAPYYVSIRWLALALWSAALASSEPIGDTTVSVVGPVVAGGDYKITYSIDLGTETNGRSVYNLVFITIDDFDNVHTQAAPDSTSLMAGVTNVVSYTVPFDPAGALLMGATSGTIGGVEPDKPHVVITANQSFRGEIAGLRWSYIFVLGEQGYTVPRLRDPTSTHLAELGAMVTADGILEDPIHDLLAPLEGAQDIDIIHFSCARPNCRPNCDNDEPCCCDDDCFGGGTCGIGGYTCPLGSGGNPPSDSNQCSGGTSSSKKSKESSKMSSKKQRKRK
jgi:hypothetical protein